MKKEGYKKYTPKIREQKNATYSAVLYEDTREMLQDIMERNQIQYARMAINYCIEAVWFDQIGSVAEEGGK